MRSLLYYTLCGLGFLLTVLLTTIFCALHRVPTFSPPGLLITGWFSFWYTQAVFILSHWHFIDTHIEYLEDIDDSDSELLALIGSIYLLGFPLLSLAIYTFCANFRKMYRKYSSLTGLLLNKQK